MIQDELLNRLVRKRLNTVPGFSSLTPELMPVFVVEGPEPDHAFEKGIALHSGLALGSALAGNLTNIVLWNPTNSGLLVTVRNFSLRAGTASEIVGGIVALATDRTNLTRTGTRDSRNRVDGIAVTTTRARVSWDNTVAALVSTTVNGTFYQNNGTTQTFHEIPFVLSPGFALAFTCQTANAAMQLCVQWTERPFNPSELV